MKKQDEDLTEYRSLGGLTMLQFLLGLALLGIIVTVLLRYFFQS